MLLKLADLGATKEHDGVTTYTTDNGQRLVINIALLKPFRSAIEDDEMAVIGHIHQEMEGKENSNANQN